jgi:hypothetical protein
VAAAEHLRIQKVAARQPSFPIRRIAIFIAAPVAQILIEKLVDAAKIGLVAEQRFSLIGETPGRIPIVVVKIGDEGAAASSHPRLSLAPRVSFLGNRS